MGADPEVHAGDHRVAVIHPGVILHLMVEPAVQGMQPETLPGRAVGVCGIRPGCAHRGVDAGAETGSVWAPPL